jgi:hypothetical protein
MRLIAAFAVLFPTTVSAIDYGNKYASGGACGPPGNIQQYVATGLGDISGLAT